MPGRCAYCGKPPTAGPEPLKPEVLRCLDCAAITTITVPVTQERKNRVPQAIVQGPAWPITAKVTQDDTLWLHQANALQSLDAGENVIVATPTASGKSIIFQLWTMHQLKGQAQATALIFYPTKALANDQARLWMERCQALGLPENTVGQIDGDVPMRNRDHIIGTSRIIIMTPDVCHAWLLRRANVPSLQSFLANLAVIIIDEAHTYEFVFGSHSAYLFRRLFTAAANAGNKTRPQFIAATATIMEPDQHLQKLTGQDFTLIGEDQNGSPRFTRTMHHVGLKPGRENREQEMAQLITHIIDADLEAQVIAFHDSRQGVERIVQMVGRPNSVMPYRSGYTGEDRKNIEEHLRNNSLRAVVSTSALELGIDIPDLNYGITMDLPPSRKAFHQRLGRIGRSKPGTFIVLAPVNRFADYGETLKEYYEESVEESSLYLDNDYITFQQAHCLRKELDNSNSQTRTLPDHCAWPPNFEEALRNTHGRPPPHLSNINSRAQNSQPQLAYSIRSSGEENLDIVTSQGSAQTKIGDINHHVALREAYPGAIYRHRGINYRIEKWARNGKTRLPYIEATRIATNSERTRPIRRTMADLSPTTANTINRRPLANGSITELRVEITESVEGYEHSHGPTVHYIQAMAKDPRRTRKEYRFPTSAVHIQLSEPWFDGDSGEPWQTRHQLARALQGHLSYHKSIPLQDLGFQVENIIIETPRGHHVSDNSIVLYDNIYGGMGFIQHIFQNLEEYAKKLTAVLEERGRGDRALSPRKAYLFLQALIKDGPRPEQPTLLPGPASWWRIIREGSDVVLYDQDRGDLVQAKIQTAYWDHGIYYRINAKGGALTATDSQLTPGVNFDWHLWRPDTNDYLDLTTTS